MPFTILAVVDETTPETPLLPEPGEEPNSIYLDDGEEELLSIPAVKLSVRTVRGPEHTFLWLSGVKEIKASVVVTDQRVTAACTKYDKGGTWKAAGGLTAFGIAAVGTAVSKTRAARRRRGKTLVGHVRYEWIITVGFKEKPGVFGSEIVRLGMKNPSEGFEHLFFEFVVAKGQSAKDVANVIANEVASYRLEQMGNLTPAETAMCNQILDAEPLEGTPNQFESYVFVDLSPEVLKAYNVLT